MFLENVYTPGLAHLSYVLGDSNKAVVIDPQRDIDTYINIARDNGVKITHIFETHKNEDFATGSVELSRWTDAQIYHGHQTPFRFGNPVHEGDVFGFSDFRLSVLSTPGHTAESISLVLYDLLYGEKPIAVFTGDALLVGSTGRTDLMQSRDKASEMLYDSIHKKLLPLGDGIAVYPAHGAGSVCGVDMAPRNFSTIGYERQNNPFLQMSKEDFTVQKMDEQYMTPPSFRQIARLNVEGPVVLQHLPEPAPLDVEEFAHSLDHDLFVLDVRATEAYAGANIPESVHVPSFLIAAYAGWMVPYGEAIGLVADDQDQLEEATRQLVRLGYDNVVCYLGGSMSEWELSGRRFNSVPTAHISEVMRRQEVGEQFIILDVRSKQEAEEQEIPQAFHMFLGEVENRIDELPHDTLITTMCSSGQRSMIAASILLKHGFELVEACLGSLSAMKAVKKKPELAKA